MEAWIVSRQADGEPWGEAIHLIDSECVPSDWAPDGSGVSFSLFGAQEMVLVSPEGEESWRYDPAAAGLSASVGRQKFSRGGSTIFYGGFHEDRRRGIWAIAVQGGEPSLLVADDAPDIGGLQYFSVDRECIYVTVAEHEVDIRVMDVDVEP